MRIICTGFFVASISLVTSSHGFADTLTLVKSVHLSAPIWSAHSASSDGSRVVVQLRGTDKRPSGLQVIDTFDIQHPRLAGFIPLPNHEEIALSGGSGKEEIALSSDGKLALVAIATEKEIFRKETGHDVIALDLSDANNPKEIWRKSLSARKVSLSADANAYAYSKLSTTNPKIWETTVIFVKDTEKPIVLKESEYSFGDMQISAHAKLLAFNSHSQLRVWDLATTPPKLYEQEFVGHQRYGCMAAVLENGYIVVNDSRFKRLGVYKLSSGMPRESTLAYDGALEYCDPINPTAPEDRLSYVSVQIDFHNPKAPSMGNAWVFADEVHPIAQANNILFAYYVNDVKNPELKVYRIERNHPTTDWQVLDSKHTAIMEMYNADLKSKKPSPYIEATKRLEDAGILAALDAPIENISLQQAAAILNDYAFLLIKKNISTPLIERTLRRAIFLDPTRRVAYLNLADFLQENLSKHDGDAYEKNRQVQEIRKNYQTYLNLGGKPTPSINAFLKGDPALHILKDFCSGIAAYAKAGRLGEMVSNGGTNILVNGRKVDLVFGADRTPFYYGFDSETDFPLKENDLPSLPSEADELESGGELGVITYRNESHILYYNGLTQPVSSISLLNGRTCRF